MNKPSIVRFTLCEPQDKNDAQQVFESLELLKKDLYYILSQLEEKIDKLEK